MVRQWYQLFPSRNIDAQWILESNWPQNTPDYTQTRAVVWNATFCLWLSTWKKLKDIRWSFPVLLLVKESFNLTEWETKQTTSNQNGSLSSYIPLMTFSVQKTKITWFFPIILMIKKSGNLIGWKAQLVFPWWLPTCFARNLRHWSILSRILVIKESCYLIGQQAQLARKTFSNTASPWSLTRCKITFILLDSFQRYLIDESCNVIGGKAQPATPKSQVLPFFGDYLCAKNLTYKTLNYMIGF